MYAEITSKTFYKLIDGNVSSKYLINMEREERAEKCYYNIGDTVLISIFNYVSCITQYYIRDINA